MQRFSRWIGEGPKWRLAVFVVPLVFVLAVAYGVFGMGGSSTPEGDDHGAAVTASPRTTATTTPRAGSTPAATTPAGAATADATSTATPPPQTGYTVSPGDSLSTICAAQVPAMATAACVDAIVELNGLAGPDQLAAGQTLTLPSGSATVAQGPAATAVVASTESGENTTVVVAATSTPEPATAATQVATSLPTAAAAAVASATATPAVGVDTYIDALEPAIELYGASLDLLEALFAAANLNDATWRANVSEAADGLIAAGDVVRATTPPSCMQGAHAKFISAAGQFDAAASSLHAGVAQLDAGRFTTANDQLGNATTTLADAIDSANAAEC